MGYEGQQLRRGDPKKANPPRGHDTASLQNDAEHRMFRRIGKDADGGSPVDRRRTGGASIGEMLLAKMKQQNDKKK